MTIELERPLPVHIFYSTAWVDSGGTLELRRDIYRHDAWLAATLAAETPLWADIAPLLRLPPQLGVGQTRPATTEVAGTVTTAAVPPVAGAGHAAAVAACTVWPRHRGRGVSSLG